MTTNTDYLTPEQRGELRALETEFEAVGGRGAELADRIDELRAIAQYGPAGTLITEYLENLHGDDGGMDSWDGTATDGYILVERANSDGGHWITQHDTPQQAADYHDNQEYAEDFEIVELIDVATGETYEAETHFVTEFGVEPDPTHDRIVAWCREANLEVFIPIFELIRQRSNVEDAALAEVVERLDLNDLYAVTLGPIIDTIEHVVVQEATRP